MKIQTPLGVFDINFIQNDHVNSLEEERVFKWGTIKTDICTPRPALPEGMEVNETVLVSLEILANKKCASFNIVCACADKDFLVEGGIESGQYLDAITWEDCENILTLATRDSEHLAECAYSGKIVPKRFTEKVSDDGTLSWVNYLENGLSINVPDLEENEILMLNFSLSWLDKSKAYNEISTWYATDIALP